MRRMIRLLLLSVFVTLLSVPLAAQDEKEAEEGTADPGGRFSMTFGAAAGNFAIDAIGFNDIYSNRSISRIYFAGIGTRSVSVIAKYRQFYAHGTSPTIGIAAAGKAEWQQKQYAAGIRFRSDNGFLYGDLLYVISRAQETITTVEPVVERLTARQESESKGVGAAVGLSVKILGPLGVFIEGEYTTMTNRGKNAQGENIPQTGGQCAAAGVHITF